MSKYIIVKKRDIIRYGIVEKLIMKKGFEVSDSNPFLKEILVRAEVGKINFDYPHKYKRGDGFG